MMLEKDRIGMQFKFVDKEVGTARNAESWGEGRGRREDGRFCETTNLVAIYWDANCPGCAHSAPGKWLVSGMVVRENKNRSSARVV
jgi:hypothetical protein